MSRNVCDKIACSWKCPQNIIDEIIGIGFWDSCLAYVCNVWLPGELITNNNAKMSVLTINVISFEIQIQIKWEVYVFVS